MCSGWANIGQDAPPCRSKGRRQRGPNRAGHRPPLRYHAVMLLRLSGACAWSPWPLVPVAPQALGIPLHQPSAGGAQAKRTGATVPEHLQEPGGCSTNRCHDARRMWKVMEGEGGNQRRGLGRVRPIPAQCAAMVGSWRSACFLTRANRAPVRPLPAVAVRCVRAQRPVSLGVLIPRSSDVAANAPYAAHHKVAFRFVVLRCHSQPC